jgi:hypothetical protein
VPTEDRCVAVIDVLGFRELVATGNLEDLAGQLEKLLAAASNATMWWAYSDTSGKGGRGREKLHKLLFSDTLFLWSDPVPADHIRREARLSAFLSLVARLIGNALAHELPLRAGVAFGPVLIAKRGTVILGQPVVDAYLTEATQEWIGGAIHDSFPRYATSSGVDFNVPTKGTEAMALTRALDWVTPEYAERREEKNAVRARLKDILVLGAASAKLSSVARKYANAISFFDNRMSDLRRWNPDLPMF